MVGLFSLGVRGGLVLVVVFFVCMVLESVFPSLVVLGLVLIGVVFVRLGCGTGVRFWGVGGMLRGV